MTVFDKDHETASPSLGPSPRQVQIGLRWNIVAGMLAMIWLTLLGTPLTMLMESLDADAFMIGLMVGIQQVAMILQIPGALLSGLFRRRKWIWAGLAMVHRVVWFLPLIMVIDPRFTGPSGIRLILIMVAVSSVFAQLSVSTWHAWMADLIPEPQRSRFWGMRQSLLWMVYTPTLLVFGYLLDFFPDPRHPEGHFFGFALVFALGALAGCLDIVAHLKVPEPPPVLTALRRNLRDRMVMPFRNRDFSWLTAGMTVWYFNLGLIGSFAILFLTRKFGFSYSQLAILNLSSSLAVIVGGLLWGFFIKRTGMRSFMISMMLVAPAFTLAWFFLRNTVVTLPLPWLGGMSIMQPMLVLIIANFLSSLFHCGVGLCQLNALAVLTPREDRSMAMAVHWTCIGLGSALGPLLGGALVDWFEVRFPMLAYPAGFRFGFMHLLVLLHVAIAWAVALPLTLRLRSLGGELPLSTTLSRMFVGNPLRLVGNILMMDTATTSRRRARAVRGIGRQRVALAVTDLVEQLHNPVSHVREAAASALGSIGNRDAVAALVTELNASDTGLTLPVLRALQKAADPAALPAVLPMLHHQTPEISRAAARTLAAFRDRRAVAPLVERMRVSPHASVTAACAEALEALGDPAAARAMLMRLPEIAHPVIRQTLAVAVANLFGNRDTFYRLIENESRHPGTMLDTLLDGLGDEFRGFLRKRMLPVDASTRCLQSLRHRAAAGDAQGMLRYLRQATRLAGASLYRVPRHDDDAAWENDIAAQNERFGVVLEFLRCLTACAGGETEAPPETQTRDPGQAPVDPEDIPPIGLPLAIYLLTVLLQEERRRRRI